jgi:hypothetical protein
MNINTNVGGWLRLLLFAAGSIYLWRSGIRPRPGEPQGKLSRSIRIVGAVMVSAVTLYFLGYGLGLYHLFYGH